MDFFLINSHLEVKIYTCMEIMEAPDVSETAFFHMRYNSITIFGRVEFTDGDVTEFFNIPPAIRNA